MLIVWAWAAAVAVVALFAALRSWVPRAQQAPDPHTGEASAARVLLLRPCAGLDAHLDRTLDSTARARTRHTLEVVFSVAHEGDAAWSTVQRAARTLAAGGGVAEARLAPSTLPNPKCGQLAAILRDASSDVVVIADADVDLTGVDLDRLIDPLLSSGGPAATFAPPVEVERPTGLGDRASQAVLDSSLHAFPLLAGLDRRGFVGKLFAVRRDALDEVGGFTALGEYLGEDMELARRLRAAGHHTCAVGLIAHARPSPRTLGATIDRYARWLAVIRAQRPALLLSYPLLFFPTLPLVILSVAGGSAGPAALALGARVGVALAARRAAGRRLMPGLSSAIVLADVALAAAWLRAITRTTVSWRGRPLRLMPGGRVRAASTTTP